MAENILTRKIGGVPGWAIGGGAIVIGLAFFYFRGKGQPGAQASQQPGSLTNNPAASSVPYVPSVTVTGIPQSSSAANNPTSSTTSSSIVAGSNVPTLQGSGGNIPVYIRRQWANGDFQPVSTIPFGTKMNVTGSPVTGTYYNQPATWLPVDLFGTSNTYFVSASDITQGSGGSGGWGQAGTTNPVAFMGWTWGGFQPIQGNPSGAILSQRAGIPTAGSGGRFDYGGAGAGSSNTRVTRSGKDFKRRRQTVRR